MKFLVRDLFTLINNPQLDKRYFTFKNDAPFPYFTRTENNNGILGKVKYLDEQHKIQGNSLAVGMISMKFHYMKNDFYAGQFTKTAIPKFENFNERIALYFISMFNKKSEYFKTLLIRDFENVFLNTELELPSSNGINPDFSFIERYIQELEQNYIEQLELERISELNKYLKTTGLNDYLLNDEDIKTLNKKVLFKNFKVNELFDIHPTKTYKGNNSYLISKNGKIPVVANTSTNNGIGGYSNLMATEKGGIITFSDTTTADSIFYQPNDFIGYSHVQGMYPYSNLWNEKSLRYFMTIFKKVALSKNFDYANKFNRKLALEFVVMLPTIDGTNLDYDYMEKYITAIEKLTIKNVVEYKDDIIAKTKEICKSK